MQRKLSGKEMCNVSSYVTLKYFQWAADYLQILDVKPRWNETFINETTMLQLYIAGINTVWLYYC